jgi:hypothetical protein
MDTNFEKSAMEGNKKCKSTGMCTGCSILCAGLAVLSMYLRTRGHAIFGWVFTLLNLTAVLTGLLAIVQIVRSHEWRKFSGRGKIYLLFISAAVAFWLEADILGRLHDLGQPRYTEATMLRLRNGLMVYAAGHNGRLPSADSWCDAVLQGDRSLSKKDFRFPGIRLVDCDCMVAFNSNLAGLPLATISDDAILLFEAYGPWNVSGAADLLRDQTDLTVDIRRLLLVDGTIRIYDLHDGKIKRRDPNTGQFVPASLPLRWNP